MPTEEVRPRVTPAPVKVSERRPARSFVMAMHLWLGLSLGTLLVLIALSGSTLIFRYELERVFFRSLTHASSSGPMNLDACMSAAQSIDPHKTARSARLPVYPDGTLEWTTVPIGQTTKEEATYVYTDPHSCAVLGTRGPKKDVMSFVVNFHHILFMKKVGPYLQTSAAATAILMAISGLMLWWPKSFTWSRFKPRASARPLHYAIGFWAMWPLLVIAFTGAYMAWHSAINKALIVEPAAVKKQAVADKEVPASDAAKKKPALALSLNTIFDAARAAKPDARFRILTIPQKPKEPVAITYLAPGDYGRAGNNQIFLKQNDAGAARVVNVVEVAAGSRTKRILTNLMQIHYGEWGGITSRLLWCATGMMPSVLFLSGLLMWRRRIRAQLTLEKALSARIK